MHTRVAAPIKEVIRRMRFPAACRARLLSRSHRFRDTLSGGWLQPYPIGNFCIGSGLRQACVTCLDEPSIGLHPAN